MTIDFNKLAQDLLPSILRKSKRLAMLGVMLSPLATMYATWLVFLANAQKQALYNGQTIVLESILNDVFDPMLRRITLNNIANEIEPVFFPKNELAGEPVYIDKDTEPMYIGLYADYLNATGLEVIVPIELNGNELAIKSQLNRYLIASVKYIITYY
ncbi:hypothetical protein SAMN05421780_101531 [Flexibacter flexilis DSM 6793]|uniref:Uncharacterized protein n=1 Tax=Flexibacter flexilis DSM 6793 TaxID=927664 RepID=A0A1I1E4L4_9BACT|nr:hypothetical protein [Flexibacter flexilis]SFB79870.1 hypothetical protein SAMN05421780_101531 [Flexibacter flexilis DSM 6793]